MFFDYNYKSTYFYYPKKAFYFYEGKYYPEDNSIFDYSSYKNWYDTNWNRDDYYRGIERKFSRDKKYDWEGLNRAGYRNFVNNFYTPKYSQFHSFKFVNRPVNGRLGGYFYYNRKGNRFALPDSTYATFIRERDVFDMLNEIYHSKTTPVDKLIKFANDIDISNVYFSKKDGRMFFAGLNESEASLFEDLKYYQNLYRAIMPAVDHANDLVAYIDFDKKEPSEGDIPFQKNISPVKNGKSVITGVNNRLAMRVFKRNPKLLARLQKSLDAGSGIGVKI